MNQNPSYIVSTEKYILHAAILGAGKYFEIIVYFRNNV